MSQVVPAFLRTFSAELSMGLVSGASWAVTSSPSAPWDLRDWNFQGFSLWNFLGCPKVVPALLGTTWEVSGYPKTFMGLGKSVAIPDYPEFSKCNKHLQLTV